MNKDRIVFCLSEIQKRLQYFVFHFYHFHRPIHCFRRLSRNNRHSIPNESNSLIQNQSVIRTWLRIRLSRHRESLLRTVLICVDRYDPRYFPCSGAVDITNQGVGVRTSQYFDDEAVLRRQIISIDRFPRHQRLGINLWYRLIYLFHTSILFFLSDTFPLPGVVRHIPYTDRDFLPGTPGSLPGLVSCRPYRAPAPWPAHS